MRRFDDVTRPLALFRRAPLYALALTGSLALGIATACGAFALVKRALIDPLAYPGSDRIVTVRTMIDGEVRLGTSYLFGEELRGSPLFTAVSADWAATVTFEAPGASERLTAVTATPEYFDVLGVAPALGSPFRRGDTDTVVVSAAFHERALGSDPAVIGRHIAIDGIPRRIVGVMPRGFPVPYVTEAEMLLPLATAPLQREEVRGQRGVIVQARLAEGVTVEAVRAYLAVFGAEQRNRHQTAYAGQSWVADRLQDVQVEDSRPLIVALAAGSGLLMLIVLTNVAGLAATRAGQLRQAHAIQLALGASRSRLFRHRLSESLVLSAVATAAGLWLASLFLAWSATRQQTLLEDVPAAAFDLSVAGIGIAIGVIAAFVAALVPHRSLRTMSAAELLGSTRGFTSARLARARSVLTVAQVAIAVVLVIGATLLVRTVTTIAATPLGYDPSAIVSFTLSLPAARYAEPARQQGLERAVLERLRGIEGVENAAASVGMPGGFLPVRRIAAAGRPDLGAQPASFLAVAPGFFDVLAVPVRAGRAIDASDRAGALDAVVVNERLARLFWPNGDPLGARLRIDIGLPRERDAVVAGMVADVRQNGPAEEVMPTVYLALDQNPALLRTFSIRTAKPLAALAPDLRSAVHAADPLLAMPAPRTEVERLNTWAARHRRFVMSVLVMFGVFASVLSALGLYAVVSLNAQSRRREFALRMALGARYQQVGWLVLRQAIRLGAIGAGVGVTASFAVTGTLQSLLHGIDRTDPTTLLTTVIAIVALAGVASLLPALRAARIDPVTMLKAG
jgi:putative ABC transport system permease protein